MNKCPCEQCICLAICKCRVRSMKGVRDFSSILKCELLSEYLGRANDRDSHVNYWREIDMTRLVYGLKPLFKRRYYRKDKI